MKRTISILTILFLCFCFSGVGLAAPKPPAKMCLSLQGSPLVMILVIKAMGNVRTADGTTQFYTVNGVIINPESTTVPPPWNAPIIGTGHMYTGANENEFHFSGTGSTALSPLDVVRVDAEVYWNVSSYSGSLFFKSSNGIEGVYLLNLVGCDPQILPFERPTSDPVIAISGYQRVTATEEFTNLAGSHFGQASCPEGTKALGGTAYIDWLSAADRPLVHVDDFPSGDTGWTGVVSNYNAHNVTGGLKVVVICAPVP
jgi:hypothetical protein